MSKLATVPIIDFSKENESFRSKLFDFMIENSIDFERDIVFDEGNSKNGATFNAMVRIFNIKKNSLTPQKKLPQHIRASIYQNLVSRPIDEELKEKIKQRKSQSPKPKPKPKPRPKESLLKVPEQPKQVRAIRNSIYSHLVKFSPPKTEKDFEEINKTYKTCKSNKIRLIKWNFKYNIIKPTLELVEKEMNESLAGVLNMSTRNQKMVRSKISIMLFQISLMLSRNLIL